MIQLNGYTISPAIFPDKTSQVWHLPEGWILPAENTILWKFEHEAEFMHLAQLKMLVDPGRFDTTLVMPYMPYARQDKEISNEATFALRTFIKLLNSLKFKRIVSFDVHNPTLTAELLSGFENVQADIDDLASQYDCVCFPDEGAYKRYSGLVWSRSVLATKNRDPSTGRLTTGTIKGNVAGERILIVDDLCDGGATFIDLTKALLAASAKSVSLYVTHGLFTKGTKVLRDAGICHIHTPEGEVHD